jgi:hypothetical protein
MVGEGGARNFANLLLEEIAVLRSCGRKEYSVAKTS